MPRLVITVIALVITTAAQASSLRIAPVLIDATEPTRAAVVTLRNESGQPITVQARVFRWRQVGGADRLEATTQVVASPPIGAIGAGAENLLRIVRVSSDKVVGEESYRLVVDQLPQAKDRKPGTINLLMRHSVPVFFGDGKVSRPRLAWTVTGRANHYLISVTNNGGSRARISNLTMAGKDGQPLSKAEGLVGYVLAGSTIQWRLASNRSSYSGSAEIRAHSESGPINVQVAIRR